MLQQAVIDAVEPITLNIDSVDPDELIIVKSISGLLPADVTLFTGDFARDGGYYQGRRLGQRNVVFNLKLNPDYANDVEVSDIRESLYSAFYEPSTGDGVIVVLKDDRRPDRFIQGYTEKTAGELFSKDTSMQFSLVCVEPYLLSVDVETATDVTGWTSVPVTYGGTAKRGLEMDFKVNVATSQLVVDIGGQKMTLTRNFIVGDIVRINTLIGLRSIVLNPAGAATDIMASLTPTSTWLQLQKGVNTIKAYGTAESDGKVVLTKYTYKEAWWGV